MNRVRHVLGEATSGTSHHVVSEHFGRGSGGKKVYVQAALHADEIPPMLVAAKLRSLLFALERVGDLRSEIVLVALANPLGLSQRVLGAPLGRFDLATGNNFNRNFPSCLESVTAAVEGKLGSDPVVNMGIIRSTWGRVLRSMSPQTEFDELQRLLMVLSHDADVTLDLHCSTEAAMHIYTGETIWTESEPLARYLGACASLLAIDAGGQSFDEAHSHMWWLLQKHFGSCYPVPSGNIAVTVEHRGRQDVEDELASRDASAIIHYLQYLGMIAGDAPPLPPLVHPATPLAGSEQFVAEQSGVLIFHANLGEKVEIGEQIFDLLDPLTGSRTTCHSHTAGRLYMRTSNRFVRRGDWIARVSGSEPQRTGKLLSH